MLPWTATLSGRLDQRVLESDALRGNPLGDPHERPLWVQLPAGYDDASRRYPTAYVLQGFGGLVTSWANRSAYKQPFFELVDEIFASGDAPPVIVVYVDSWTAYGGSQFVDSPGTGNYHTHLCDEVVPFVDRHYRTLPERDHRGVVGKSSGGFGAMITPMLRPDLFGYLATHAGDALYETCYLRELGPAARALRDYDGDIGKFWADFRSREPFTKATDQLLWLFLGISACFSADADGTVNLPFDPHTGRLRDDVWQRWLAWDPVRMLEQPSFADAMKSMLGIWIDAGTNDDFHLDLGAQAFRDGLLALGVDEQRIRFELTDANHWNIDVRYPLSLRWLAEQMS
jgi:Putative esterase